MKKLFILSLALISVFFSLAQTNIPQLVSFSAVVRDANNQLLVNTPVSIRLSFKQGGANGPLVYCALHQDSTNANGFISIQLNREVLGTGCNGAPSTAFENIPWQNGGFWMEVEYQTMPSSPFVNMGQLELASSFYAFSAGSAERLSNFDLNGIQNGDIMVYNSTNQMFEPGQSGIASVQWANVENKPNFATVAISGDYNDLTNTPIIPENLSAFTNDAGYLTSFTETQILSISNDTIYLTGGSFVKLPAGFSGDYSDLTNTPTIPTVPENISEFTNDANYLIEYTETDPQFNAWDKDYNDLLNTPTIPTVPENVSAFTNDAGYLTEYIETDPLFNAWNKDYADLTNKPILSISNDTIYLTGGGFVKLPATSTGAMLAPTTTNQAASNLQSFSATLNGTVNANGLSSTVVFEWGLTTAYGNVANVSQSPVTGTTDVAVSADLINLQSNTTYHYRIKATNAVNVTYSSDMSFTTLLNLNPCEGVTPPVGYGVVSSSGRCWLDRNLGATAVATSSTDAAAYGDLYQWGRGTDGHQIRTTGTTSTLSSSDTPGHGNFITNGSSPYDWRSPRNDNLWQGVAGVNNPCPSGYRIPTATEWDNERASWSSNNAAGAFASPLKLPVAGNRGNVNGSLNNVGSYGYYWSSTVGGTNSQDPNFSSSGAAMGSSDRATGFSVRCIKD